VIELNGSDLVLELRLRQRRPRPLPGRGGRAATSRGGVVERLARRAHPAPVARDLVARSALTLRGLCFNPTGAIMARHHHLAAGDDRRGAQLGLPLLLAAGRGASARALVSLGSTGEAEAFLTWLHGILDRMAGGPERLHSLYTLHSTSRGPEAVIDTLPAKRHPLTPLITCCRRVASPAASPSWPWGSIEAAGRYALERLRATS